MSAILGFSHPFLCRGHRIGDDFVNQPADFAAAGATILPSTGKVTPAIAPSLRVNGCAPAPEKKPTMISAGRYGPWVVGDKDAVVWPAGSFKPDARARAGRADAIGLPPLLSWHPCRRVRSCAAGVHFHCAVEQPLCGVVARIFAHLGQQVQVHPAGKGPSFARSDHAPLMVSSASTVSMMLSSSTALDRP